MKKHNKIIFIWGLIYLSLLVMQELHRLDHADLFLCTAKKERHIHSSEHHCLIQAYLLNSGMKLNADTWEVFLIGKRIYFHVLSEKEGCFSYKYTINARGPPVVIHPQKTLLNIKIK